MNEVEFQKFRTLAEEGTSFTGSAAVVTRRGGIVRGFWVRLGNGFLGWLPLENQHELRSSRVGQRLTVKVKTVEGTTVFLTRQGL